MLELSFSDCTYWLQEVPHWQLQNWNGEPFLCIKFKTATFAAVHTNSCQFPQDLQRMYLETSTLLYIVWFRLLRTKHSLISVDIRYILPNSCLDIKMLPLLMLYVNGMAVHTKALSLQLLQNWQFVFVIYRNRGIRCRNRNKIQWKIKYMALFFIESACVKVQWFSPSFSILFFKSSVEKIWLLLLLRIMGSIVHIIEI